MGVMTPERIVLSGLAYFLGMCNGFFAITSFSSIIQNALLFMIILLLFEIVFVLGERK